MHKIYDTEVISCTCCSDPILALTAGQIERAKAFLIEHMVKFNLPFKFHLETMITDFILFIC